MAENNDTISRLCTTCKSAVPIRSGLACLRQLSPVDARPMLCGAQRIGTTGCGAAGVHWELKPEIDPAIAAIIADPAASYWLKAALGGLIDRDPVDAANDTKVLAELMGACARSLKGEVTTKIMPDGTLRVIF